LGLKERQERDREAVSRAILDAARDLFVAEGYQNVSMRKIAERIEYSPAAIYGYFPSKDDIFFALAEEGFRILIGHTLPEKPRPEASADPLYCIRQALIRVYEFSKSHPEYFALMFLDRSVPRISKGLERFEFLREISLQLDELIQKAIDAGLFPAGSRPDVLFRIMLAAVHGVAVMRLCDRLAPGEDADRLAVDVLEAVIAGLRAGSPVSSASAGCPEPGDLE
jgi:AcrR family transcriptional regulator